MSWFGGPFAFDGRERWQLWFDNPNKAAVLLAELALLGLALLFSKRRRIPALGFLSFLLPSLAMVLTFSRGGMVAWLVSTLIVLWRRLREFGWSRRVMVAAGSVILVLAVSANCGLSRRMAQGFAGDDRSVTNRFDVWEAVPQMMCDAPFGWGRGKSGSAYMDWYQPLDRHERYRTLVNSHLTWFVETGWIGAFAWIVAWAALLHFGVMVGLRLRRWSFLVQWLCLGIAGSFSSVMESPWLWIVPSVTALYEASLLRREWLTRLGRCTAFGLVCGSALLALTLVGVKAFCGDSQVRKWPNRIEWRGEGCTCWVVTDADVLGGENYPRVLRGAAAERSLASFCFVAAASGLPEDATTLVFCGKADSGGRRGSGKTIWLSPSADAPVRPGDMVIAGEFASGDMDFDGANRITVSGAADYIPDWPGAISTAAK